MTRTVNWKTIWIHVAGCISFLLLPLLFNPRPTDINVLLHSYRTLVEIITYLSLLGFFYVNFYWLLPNYYFTGKIAQYVLLALACFLVIAFVPDIFFDAPPPRMGPPPDGHRARPLVGIFQFGQSLFLFLVVLFFSIMLKVSLRLRLTEKEKLSAEISYLKAQINPHFLFNTLNGIYSLALSKSDETAGAVVKLSNMMRYVITEAEEEFVPLEKEIAYLKNFIELQQIRFGENLKLDVSIEGEIFSKSIAPLLVMPMVENAFKYGVNPEEQSFISIRLAASDSQIQFNVVNAKAHVKNIEQTGLGLRNVRKRLDLIYPGRHELKINDGEKTYHVTLTLR